MPAMKHTGQEQLYITGKSRLAIICPFFVMSFSFVSSSRPVGFGNFVSVFFSRGVVAMSPLPPGVQNFNRNIAVQGSHISDRHIGLLRLERTPISSQVM